MINVLLIGVGYFPYPTAGEKNYFFRLCPLLDDQVRVSIFSLNDYGSDTLFQDTPNFRIPVYCARRPFHTNYTKYFINQNNYISYHHRHKPQQEILEKFVSILYHLPRLSNIIRKHEIQLIHFMDNFGFGMPFLKRVFPNIKITYSAANYDPRQNQSLYNKYLRLSLNNLDGAGVYTEAYKKILLDIGVDIPQRITRWGVEVNHGKRLGQAEKVEIRQELGVIDSEKLLLWSGFLQQIQVDDFYKTVDIAHQVASATEGVFFLFAFKPETYQAAFSQSQRDRVRVMTGLENFGDVLEAADIFLSPIGNKKSTVSPPLTWLEAMSKGTPVITTNVLGVDEVISHKINGFIAEDYDGLFNIIVEAINAPNLDQISDMAVGQVKEKFDIHLSSKALVNFWKEIFL